MASLKEMYGTTAAPSIFDGGKPGKTYCNGEGTPIFGNLYGIIAHGRQIPLEEISFCEYCAKKLPVDRIYKGPKYDIQDQTKQCLHGSWYTCDCSYTDKLLKYGMDERCLHYDGYRVTVNIVDPKISNLWRPTTKLASRPKTADENGVLISNLPSGCHYEISISTDPKYYNDKYAFKITDMKFGDGKVVTYANVPTQEGYSNIMHHQEKGISTFISSFHSLKDNTRFYFQRMTSEEESSGMSPEHYNKSNKIFITIGLYEIIRKPKPVYRSSQVVDDCIEEKCVMRGSKSSNVGGGATYSTDGKSFEINAKEAQDTYSKYPIKTTEISIQLVNDESNEQLKEVSKKICSQAKMELTKKLNMLEERERVIKGHSAQETIMLDFC